MEQISGITIDIPDHVQRGEVARLFPVLSESSREGRAASVLLSSLSVVEPFADALLRRLGRPIGKRAKVKCFTEVVLKSDPKFRPDGLIVIDTGRGTWSALVECKIGKAILKSEQLENYLRKARENNIDCVITISNELVADPKRPPTSVSGHLTKRVGHFHYSWLAIRSEAEIVYTQEIVSDPEKNFILAELIRFLSHRSAGVEGFTQMPSCWPDVIKQISAGHTPKKNDVVEVAGAWLQEEKELSLILSRSVSRRCIARSEKKVKKDSYDPVDATISDLVNRQRLSTDFQVPDAASEIRVCADLRSRTTRISMNLRAPEDKKTTAARLNWLLRQLKSVDPKNTEIVAHWPGKAKSTYGSLSHLLEDPKKIIDQNSKRTPYSFDVVEVCHTPASFAARRRFVQQLESAVQQFYGNIGRHLTAWSPKPPTPAEKTVAATIQQKTEIGTERSTQIQQVKQPEEQESPKHNDDPGTVTN